MWMMWTWCERDVNLMWMDSHQENLRWKLWNKSALSQQKNAIEECGVGSLWFNPDFYRRQTILLTQWQRITTVRFILVYSLLLQLWHFYYKNSMTVCPMIMLGRSYGEASEGSYRWTVNTKHRRSPYSLASPSPYSIRMDSIIGCSPLVDKNICSWVMRPVEPRLISLRGSNNSQFG